MATMRYFHPDISGSESEELLKTTKVDGRFLVRPSQNTPGNFTLSVKSKGEVMHIRIRKEKGFYDMFGGEKFRTLAELIQFYIENPEELRSKSGSIIRLTIMLPYGRVPANRWFHGSITEREAEFLLLTKSQSGGYLVGFSFHSPGNYVLSARVDDRVVHILLVYHKKRFGIVGGPQFESLEDFMNYYKRSPLKEAGGHIIQLKFPLMTSSFLPQLVKAHEEELEKLIEDSSAKSGFADELEKLNEADLRNHFSTKEADKPENFSKNRFKEIVPFDHTRVCLDRDPGIPGNTYINASWINGEIPGSDYSYIAAQSHLPGTLNDFWYMAWQEKCLVIVMLDDADEADSYWPTPEDPGFYGPIQVVSLEENKFPTHVLRHFIVCHEYEDEEDEQHTFQFQFLGWPNSTLESTQNLYQFTKDVQTKLLELKESGAQPGPLLVHCTAGVGRTGVFILTDILKKMIDHQKIEQEIDIKRSIEITNEQRLRFIQTEEQYQLLYKLIACHVQEKYA